MLGKILPACHARLLKSYLQNRTFKVRVGEALSDSLPILAGVPQGSVLGPLLYLLFTSDIPPAVRDSMLAKYADDTAYAASNLSQEGALDILQENLTSVYDWCQEKDIVMNPSKFV